MNIAFNCIARNILDSNTSVLNITSWNVTTEPISTKEQLVIAYTLSEGAVFTIIVELTEKIINILSNKDNRFKNIIIVIIQQDCEHLVTIDHRENIFGDVVKPIPKNIVIEDVSRCAIYQKCDISN